VTEGACCVETTTVLMRTGLAVSYSMVTWLLASGRSQSTTAGLAGLGELAGEQACE
jgi:hypothetical protein